MHKMEDTVTVCNRCLNKVYPSCVDGYEYQCFEHDEDLYAIETHEMDKDSYLNMIAKRIGCPRDQIEKVHCEYDAYISNNYLHARPAEGPMTLQEYYEGYSQVQKPSYRMVMKF